MEKVMGKVVWRVVGRVMGRALLDIIYQELELVLGPGETVVRLSSVPPAS